MKLQTLGTILLILALSGCLGTTTGRAERPTKCYGCKQFRSKKECKGKAFYVDKSGAKAKTKKRAWHDVWGDEPYLRDFPKPKVRAVKKKKKPVKKASYVPENAPHSDREL